MFQLEEKLSNLYAQLKLEQDEKERIVKLKEVCFIKSIYIFMYRKIMINVFLGGELFTRTITK